MKYNQSENRSELKSQILATLASSGVPMTIGEINDAMQAGEPKEIARLAYELRVTKGLVEFGPGKFSKALGKDAKTYQLTPQGRARATGYPGPTFLNTAAPAIAIPRRVAPGPHPWHQAVVPPKEPQEARVTRPLPLHLQNVREPPAPAENVTDIDAQLIEELRLETNPPEKDMTEEAAEYEAPIPAFVLDTQVEQDMAEALDKDAAQHEAAHLEAARLAIVDAMLIFAHNELRGDRAWKALERAYLAAAGETLEMCHG